MVGIGRKEGVGIGLRGEIRIGLRSEVEIGLERATSIQQAQLSGHLPPTPSLCTPSLFPFCR